MALTGYVKIDDIDGESVRVGHEDEIEVDGVHWKIKRSTKPQISKRRRAAAKVHGLTCTKRTDASSPYLALACLQGTVIRDVVLTLSRHSGDSHLDYLTITMTNAMVSEFEIVNDGADDGDEQLTEHVGFSFERVTYKYVEQVSDHSSGDEHEVSFDLTAGS